jgi:two-component system invasion response regulator UvrY
MSNILLADDHGIVRSGIKALLNANIGMFKIDEAADESEVVKRVKANHYDLIMLDINLGDSDFVKLMEWLNATAPDTSILVFSMYQEEVYGLHSLQMGAKGYLRKTATDEEILLAIRTVLDGKKYINPALAEILSNHHNTNNVANPLKSLSSRELEIALLLNSGKTLPEICTILNIQYSTANTFKRRIFEKLKLQNILSLSRLMQTFNVQE